MAQSLLEQYYLAQAGTGGSFYSGPIYQRGAGSLQRGAGIGSFLGGLIRRILPILRKGTIAVGKEVINSGSNFMTDIGNNVDPKTALKKRSAEAVSNLTKKVMQGSGYKRRASTKKPHSVKAVQASKKRKIVKKKKKKIVQQKHKKKSAKKTKKCKDIFTQ